MRIPKKEKQENTDFSVKRKILTDLLLHRYGEFSVDELNKSIRDLLTVLFNDANSNALLLRAHDALQDDESRQIYACLFLCKIIGIPDAELSFSKMVLTTLKNRLIEKGKDLSNYDDYNCNFFFDKQYFSLPQFKISPVGENNEIFIDCGAFDGGTIKDFTEYCDGKYDKIYSFEPIPSQYENTLKNIKNLGIQKVELIQKGVWSGNAVFNFSDNKAGSAINDRGTIPVEVTAIDAVVSENENVTFIKMDIEGAEFEALKGAANTIRRCKPKLAVCIYHKPSDIIQIPILILSIFPEYKFYIRHHYVNHWETVLYALAPK